jgi:tetratricopeptide (TPR) repeat protein
MMLLPFLRQIPVLVLLCALIVCTGCSTQMPPEKIATAGQALESATLAANAGNWDAAIKSYDTALGGGLNVDQYCQALMGRAMAKAQTGKFDDALKDLAQAERGAPNLEDVFALKAFVLQKKGDNAGATAAFNEARKINPRVQFPVAPGAPAAGS